MKNKFWFLTKMSLKKKIASKWFVIANIVLAIIIIALTNLNSIITYFGGDFNNQTKIYVVDETNQAYTTFQNSLKEITKATDQESNKEEKIVAEQSLKTAKEAQKDLKDKEVLVIFENDTANYIKAKVVSEKKIDNMTYQIISQTLNNTKAAVALTESNIDPVELSRISSPIAIERLVLSEKKDVDENMDLIMGTVFPTIILPFFVLIIFLVQMVGGEICEEKTTKSMEIIISNVSPKVHLGSKILASNVFVITQGLLLIVYLMIGLAISGVFSGGSLALPTEITSVWDSLVQSGFLSKLIYLIPLALILMVLSFIAYSLVAGILASMTTNMEDFQQIQTPIMIISLIGYYLAIMAGMFQGSILIKILSYVPFLSCLISPSLLLMGQISIIDVIISIIILVLFIFLLVRFGLKIYKVGILNYSNEKVWSRLAKAVKTKDI